MVFCSGSSSPLASLHPVHADTVYYIASIASIAAMALLASIDCTLHSVDYVV